MFFFVHLRLRLIYYLKLTYEIIYYIKQTAIKNDQN